GAFTRRRGIPLIDGGTVRLPAIVGFVRALDIIMTGRPIDAREAERIGLANRVVPRGRARTEAEALAQAIAEFPPHCVLNDRRAWPARSASQRAPAVTAPNQVSALGCSKPLRCAGSRAASPVRAARPARPAGRPRRPRSCPGSRERGTTRR